MSTPHGDRMKLVNRMSSRDRRRWVQRIMAAQEAVDKQQDAMADLVVEAHDAGLSQSAIGGALGLHPTTIQGWIERARERQGES